MFTHGVFRIHPGKKQRQEIRIYRLKLAKNIYRLYCIIFAILVNYSLPQKRHPGLSDKAGDGRRRRHTPQRRRTCSPIKQGTGLLLTGAHLAVLYAKVPIRPGMNAESGKGSDPFL